MSRVLAIIVIMFLTAPAYAQESAAVCPVQDKACLFDMIEKTADGVTESSWRDATYRETAKLLSHEGQTDRAIALLGKIKNPDTKALTIRGIGMAAADEKLPREEYAALFAKLTDEAKKIDHPPSYAIALTYISMSQAFAGENEGAMKTAGAMENASLRNKAYGEAGEIQARRGDIDAVLKSVSAIDDAGYKDKELRIISKVFTDEKYFDHALRIAQDIGSSYQKSQALLYILLKQITPEEASVE